MALLLAGVDADGPQLYHTDPSGTFTKYRAMAIGSGSEGAMSMLQESYNDRMTLQEAETLAITILKQVMEEQIEARYVEVATVTAGAGYRQYSTEEIKAVLDRL